MVWIEIIFMEKTLVTVGRTVTSLGMRLFE